MKRTQPLRRSPIRKVSVKRQRELREYSVKRKAFLASRPWCEVFLARFAIGDVSRISAQGTIRLTGDIEGTIHVPRSCDIHHQNKRHGSRLNDESFWMAVSREAHEWLHQHPSEARAKGWLV